MAKINDLKFDELLQHRPYSPDLAPSDYFLFSNFKKWLRSFKTSLLRLRFEIMGLKSLLHFSVNSFAVVS